MTGYTVHTGTTIKFSEGWDRIFPGGSANPAKSKTKKAAKKKSVRGPAKAKGRAKRAAKAKR